MRKLLARTILVVVGLALYVMLFWFLPLAEVNGDNAVHLIAGAHGAIAAIGVLAWAIAEVSE